MICYQTNLKEERRQRKVKIVNGLEERNQSFHSRTNFILLSLLFLTPAATEKERCCFDMVACVLDKKPLK